MRRVIAIAAAGLSLAGCSSFSTGLLQVNTANHAGSARVDPARRRCPDLAGAGLQDALLGHLPAPDTGGFTVSYTMDKFQPATVPVQVVQVPGDLFTSGSAKTDPNPVVAELQPAGPPPKAARKMMRPRKPKVPKATAAAPAADPTDRRSPAPAQRQHRRHRPPRRPADRLHCTRKPCGKRWIVPGLQRA